MSPTILVTGATGGIGSRTVQNLVSKPGITVRATVHVQPAPLGETAFVTQAVAELAGRPARSFREFARDHAEGWKRG
jgi:nucleoside-diphosphate-sugar epimerase